MRYMTASILLGVNLGLAIVSALLGMPGVCMLNLLSCAMCWIGSRK